MRRNPPSLIAQRHAWWGDIRTWIVLSFLVHLIGITSAPIEIGHSWRQCLTAMIARNFTEIDADIRFPRVDMGGAGTGIIGAEFPLLNYLMALLHQLLGPAHWHGRVLVLVTSCAGVFYFHRLLRGLFGPPIAFSSSLILLSSTWFEYSRKIMPDVFSISLVIIALYCAWRYLDGGKAAHLLGYLVLATLGLLSKMPAACLLAVLVVPVIDPRIRRARRIGLALASVPVLAATVAWYFLWVPHLLDTYGYQLYFPRDLATGARELWEARWLVLEKFAFQAFCSFAGFAAFLVGLFLLARDRGWRLWTGGAAISAVFLFFMLKTGDVFAQHSYYILPFVPVMALVAGSAVTRVPVKYRWLPLLLIGVEGVANQFHDLIPPDRNRYLLGLEAIADRYAPPGERVVVNGGLNPQYMYFLHRRGWSLTDAACRDVQQLEELAEQGAAFLFLINSDAPADPRFPVLYRDDHVQVIALRSSP